MRCGLQTLKEHTCCNVEICNVGEVSGHLLFDIVVCFMTRLPFSQIRKGYNIPFLSICEILQALFIEIRRHSHLTEDQVSFILTVVVPLIPCLSVSCAGHLL